MRERQIYKETYKKGAARLRKDRLPKLRHLTKGHHVVEAELRAAGVVEREGRTLEFQDIRVYVEADI